MQDTEDDFQEIEFNCPKCGAAFERYAGQCPECGAALGDLYSATYRPEPSRAMRVIAWTALGGVGLLLLLVAIAYLRC